MFKRNTTATALAVLIVLSVPMFAAVTTEAGPRAPVHGSLLVYNIHRPGLDISIRRRGNRVFRAGVSSPGVRSNGERKSMGFGLVGGSGWPIDAFGHFDSKGGIHSVFRGHFEGVKVVGVFYESRLEVGGGREGPPPTCGNTRPQGRYQHFVAWVVEEGGHKVPHPPIWLRKGGRDARSATQHASRSERWRTADRVGGVGELEWACRGGGPRVRFTARGGTTERVAVKIGPGVTADARLQSGNALELPLGDAAQHWRVERVSESLPPVIIFSVKRRGAGCAAPAVTHRARAGWGSARRAPRGHIARKRVSGAAVTVPRTAPGDRDGARHRSAAGFIAATWDLLPVRARKYDDETAEPKDSRAVARP